MDGEADVLGPVRRQVYVIDFGLSKRYLDSKMNQHIPYRTGKSLTVRREHIPDRTRKRAWLPGACWARRAARHIPCRALAAGKRGRSVTCECLCVRLCVGVGEGRSL